MNDATVDGKRIDKCQTPGCANTAPMSLWKLTGIWKRGRCRGCERRRYEARQAAAGKPVRQPWRPITLPTPDPQGKYWDVCTISDCGRAAVLYFDKTRSRWARTRCLECENQRRRLVEYPCATCGAPVERTPKKGAVRKQVTLCSQCKYREADREAAARGRALMRLDKPCASCGQMIYHATMEEKDACDDCAAFRGCKPSPIYVIECAECGTLCTQRRKGIRYCSTVCGEKASRRTSRQAQRTRRNADKAKRRSVIVEHFTLREIAERDKWTCHLCGGHVPDRLFDNNPNDATLDHLVSIAHGGMHSRDNVALAHFQCNSKRGAGGIVQLRLVG